MVVFVVDVDVDDVDDVDDVLVLLVVPDGSLKVIVAELLAELFS